VPENQWLFAQLHHHDLPFLRGQAQLHATNEAVAFGAEGTKARPHCTAHALVVVRLVEIREAVLVGAIGIHHPPVRAAIRALGIAHPHDVFAIGRVEGVLVVVLLGQCRHRARNRVHGVDLLIEGARLVGTAAQDQLGAVRVPAIAFIEGASLRLIGADVGDARNAVRAPMQVGNLYGPEPEGLGGPQHIGLALAVCPHDLRAIGREARGDHPMTVIIRNVDELVHLLPIAADEPHIAVGPETGQGINTPSRMVGLFHHRQQPLAFRMPERTGNVAVGQCRMVAGEARVVRTIRQREMDVVIPIGPFHGISDAVAPRLVPVHIQPRFTEGGHSGSEHNGFLFAGTPKHDT
jgi:hypothetical protein